MAKTKTELIKSASRTHSNHSKTKSQAQIKTETVASLWFNRKTKTDKQMAKTKTEHIKSASRTHSNHSKTKSQAQTKIERIS